MQQTQIQQDGQLLRSAVQVAKQRYVEQNPVSKACFLQASNHLPGGNTRSTLFADPFPLYIAKGYQNKLLDVDGHEYVDFLSDYTSALYGKSNPILKKAIVDAMEDGLQLGGVTEREPRLACLIKERFPSMDLVRFTNSGTEANIFAISTALQYTGRKRIVVFENAYHGGVLSAFKRSGHEGSRAFEMNVLRVPFDFLVLPYNDVETATKEIAQHASEIAAVLVEPMLGSGGCVPGDPQFLRHLRRLTRENGIVLIMDEVQTARLAYGGRQGLLKIDPDMTTAGKFLGGGFAFGCFGGKKAIMEMFDGSKPGAIGHGGTFNNSPLTMAAGAAALSHILTPEAMEAVNALGDYLRETLNQIIANHSAPFEVTGVGSLNQIHCTLLPPLKQLGGDLIFYELINSGFWIAQRGLLCISLETTKGQVDDLATALDRIFSTYSTRW